MEIKDYFLKGIFTKHDGQLETLQKQLHWVLRISVALCFIGHGTWGIITKAGWLPFFASQGIPLDLAWNLQPLIGAFDILMAFLILWKPRRIILFWMFLWALWTAALRPLAGNLEKFQRPTHLTFASIPGGLLRKWWAVVLRREGSPGWWAPLFQTTAQICSFSEMEFATSRRQSMSSIAFIASPIRRPDQAE